MMDFSVMAAMDSSRGIGYNGSLPWPPLKNDYDYYLSMTSQTSTPDKKVVRIKGRATWEETSVEEKTQASCINIVISNSLSHCPEHADFVAQNFEEALQQAQIRQEVERVWVMGGVKIYEEAVNHPHCKRIYLTRILGTYQADRFFPAFENKYQLISDAAVDGSLQKENDVSYRFEVYERNS